jgi:hypothetical protein
VHCVLLCVPEKSGSLPMKYASFQGRGRPPKAEVFWGGSIKPLKAGLVWPLEQQRDWWTIYSFFSFWLAIRLLLLQRWRTAAGLPFDLVRCCFYLSLSYLPLSSPYRLPPPVARPPRLLHPTTSLESALDTLLKGNSKGRCGSTWSPQLSAELPFT